MTLSYAGLLIPLQILLEAYDVQLQMAFKPTW